MTSLLLALVAPVAAQTVPASDISITSLGMQGFTTSSVGPDNGAPGADFDFLLGQRLRWTLGDRNGTTTRALADARFTLDPSPGFQGEAQPVEVHIVRQLGVEVNTNTFTLDVGRHPVYRGGPRLVDGVQGLYHVSPTLDVGAWAGFAPSFFDTDFRLRPGAGPIIALTDSRIQASLVGEVSSFGGELDRAAVLGMGRWTMNRVLEISGRIDYNFATADNTGPSLSDAQVFAVVSPTRALRFDLLYNAFSAYRYISSADLDPEQQRFAQRLINLGQVLNVQNDQVDPTVNQLFGAAVRSVKPGAGTSHFVEVMGRYRTSPDPNNRFTRIRPTVGAVRIAGKYDALLTANYLQVEERGQLDVGFLGAMQLGDLANVDLSLRALSVPDDYQGLGLYADLFVDLVAPGPDLLLLGGVSYLSEPDQDVGDGEFGVFLRMSKYLRPNRNRRRPTAPDAPAKVSTPPSESIAADTSADPAPSQ